MLVCVNIELVLRAIIALFGGEDRMTPIPETVTIGGAE
jgi:hypothetical protein